MRSTLFLGDLADAIRVLETSDAATITEIAALLDPRPETTVDREPAPVDFPDQPPPPESERPAEPHAPRAADATALQFFASRIVSDQPEGGPVLRIASSQQQPATLTTDERNERRPELQPLLRPHSKRAILSASLSTRIPMGIDVGRTIALLARREPLERLPVRTTRSVRRGVQLLLDKSSGMTPFLADQAAMTGWIRNVVGRQRVLAASFIGSPEQGLLDGARKRKAYSFPATGTPIVLLTDLGIARPDSLDNAAAADEWLAFARKARQADCPVIAFVPYPSERWPAGLHRFMTILQWDRPLTASRAAKVSAR